MALFGQLYISMRSRDGDLKEFFAHEIQSFPPFLSDFGKLHLPNTKSDMLKCLDQAEQPEPPSSMTAQYWMCCYCPPIANSQSQDSQWVCRYSIYSLSYQEIRAYHKNWYCVGHIPVRQLEGVYRGGGGGGGGGKCMHGKCQAMLSCQVTGWTFFVILTLKVSSLPFWHPKLQISAFLQTQLFISHLVSLNFYHIQCNDELQPWRSRYKDCCPCILHACVRYEKCQSPYCWHRCHYHPNRYIEFYLAQPLVEIWVAFGMGKNYRFYSINLSKSHRLYLLFIH